jgi:hypothetical protein
MSRDFFILGMAARIAISSNIGCVPLNLELKPVAVAKGMSKYNSFVSNKSSIEGVLAPCITSMRLEEGRLAILE